MHAPAPSLTTPRVILFDWHGTLVDTLDAMFAAMEEVLPRFEELDLTRRLLSEDRCKTRDDAKLVRYIRTFRRLHPRILAERRVSRSDVFNAMFGSDQVAKTPAHQAYNDCYRKHFGDVKPFQSGVYDYLQALRALGIKLGIATNRSREFLERELMCTDGGRWQALFDALVCADDVTEYKPSPQILLAAAAKLNEEPGRHVWYVGDSFVDMVAANRAGATAIFYNGDRRAKQWFFRTFAESRCWPHAVVESLDQLFDLIETRQRREPTAFAVPVRTVRPARYPAPVPPPRRVEPDWHPAVAQLTPPRAILFDWHATLVDTVDAMYHAVDDMLCEFEELGLMGRLVERRDSRTEEDAKLVAYVKRYAALHPKVKQDRKISRTDIFEILFGEDQLAKAIAHKRFNVHYRRHFGKVVPFEPQVRRMLIGLRSLPLKTGVITNRDREFFDYEVGAVEGRGWAELFDVAVCGDEAAQRKPFPDPLLAAIERLGWRPEPDIWYVGDSTTDTIAAKRAGITSVFFNGAQWDLPWLQKIFPGTERHPHKPDVVVNDFTELWELVHACWERDSRRHVREVPRIPLLTG
jgi:phosphoglycolate phosphatase